MRKLQPPPLLKNLSQQPLSKIWGPVKPSFMEIWLEAHYEEDLWLAPFPQVKVSIVSSACGSFCWNYATDTFYSIYAGATVCCNYAGLEILLESCWWYFCYTYVSGSFCCNDAGDCFCCNLQLEVSAAFMQVKVFAADMWVTSFIEIMQVRVCCNHGGSNFCSALCIWLFIL